MTFLLRLTALAISIILHEVAHGYAAWKLGDPTARDAGRLTLNPISHIDPMGSIVIPLILLMTNSPVLFGWARPVPINPAYFRDPKRGMMITGAAGPAVNLALAVLSAGVIRLIGHVNVVVYFFLYLLLINLVLAVFNLIPIPPLDGSRVVVGFLSDQAARSYLRLERYGMLIIIALLAFGLLDPILGGAVNVLLKLLLPG